MFVLHDFEFVRMRGTAFDITIDGRQLAPATFPVPFPMQGQNRSFVKYAPHTEILEVFPSTDAELRQVRTEPGTDRFTEDGIQYLFDGDALERILVEQTEIVFAPRWISPPTMSGPYRVTVDGPRSTDALVRGVSVASMTIIDAICGDITESTFDAIVNAANSGLLGGGGVDGAIHRAAGPEFLAHCKELKKHHPEGFPVGAAAALPGCDLPATWVIQTVGPNRHAGQTDPADLAACFSRSLTEAARVGAKTIAFPAISAGVYGWAPAEVASVAVAAVRSSPDLEAFTHVRFVLFSDELAQIFTEALTD